ncbi:MAG: hypothetical protein B6U72_00215 [Candidatus Altiarchaeales archaeon ex4484_2]|nr:MAG: hypothetical protein B6U72_00215 [Candidatus Altiarchaeales archaeon ex4484_2]
MEIKDILLSEETLFRDETIFTPNHIPADFMHRDSETKELAFSLKPGLRGVNPVNTLIHGPAGTGKTTAVRYLFQQIKESSGKLATVYINCEDYSTPYAIFAKIYESLYGFPPPSTGKPLEDVKERVYGRLKKEDRSLVVALDELDRLFLNKNVEAVLIDLLKAHVSYDFDRVGVIGIMIEKEHIAQLSEKARSVFNPSLIHFRPYCREEIRDILEYRVRYGFYRDVVPEEILESVVDFTHKKGDLRFGIDLLRRSALLAENDSSRSITEEHLMEVFSKISSPKARGGKLSSGGKKLLQIVEVNDNRSSGRIYELFREETGSGIKRYNQLIKELESKKLIETEYPKGKRGRSRNVRLLRE